MSGDFFRPSIEDVRATQVEIPSADSRAANEQEFFHRQAMASKELGWLGIVFGGKKEKSENIAALVIMIAFVLIVVFYFVQGYDRQNDHFERLLSALSSLITLALGYLFGVTHKSGGE